MTWEAVGATPGRGGPSRAVAPAGVQPVGPHEGYLVALCTVLAGYACVGKGFAYLGVPPLYIGEIALALGCLVLWRSRCLAALSTSPALVAAAALAAWTVLRTLPYLGAYGIDAPRDAMVVLYAAYAFVVAGLVVERVSRLGWLIGAYRRLAWIYGLLGGGLFLATVTLGSALPSFSGNTLPYIRPGEAAVHLTGAAVFAMVGLMRVRWPWIAAWIVNAAMVSPSRGAMLSYLLPLLVAAVVTGRWRRVLSAFLIAAALFTLALAARVEVALPGGGRPVGAEQMVERLGSIVGRSTDGGLDGTKQWRLRWWGTIRDYTVEGPYFWTGKGFGVNLAVDDGFVVGEGDGNPLRSPHNAHLTILARGGVPGLALWLATLAIWFGAVAGAHLRAKRRGEAEWAALFVWIGCYVASALINASFDVALEGPMQGIWFWCLFGLGAGMVMVHRAHALPRRGLPRRGPPR